jgi:hypothetical protein
MPNRLQFSAIVGRICLWALVAATAGIAACAAPVDLSAISTYATTTARAGTSFAALAADFEASCWRENAVANHLLDNASESPPPLILADVTKAALEVGVTGALQAGYTPPPQAGTSLALPTPSSAPTSTPAGRSPAGAVTPVPSASTCSTEHDISVSWNRSNGIVLSYVQSLGALAAVDAVPTPNPSPLAGPLEKIGVSSAQVAAGSTVLTTITSFFERQQQDRAITSFLAAVDPYMDGAIASLEIVDGAYAINLESEYNVLTGEYQRYVNTELYMRGQISGNSRAATRRRLAIDQQLVRTRGAVIAAIAMINQHRQASIAYGNALDAILRTHKALYAASKGRASLKDYVNVIKTTGVPVLLNLETLSEKTQASASSKGGKTK